MSISPAFKQLRQNGLRMLLVAVLAALYLFPLVRIFSMSFMSASELYASAPSIFPKAFTLENYRSIFQGNIPIFTFLKNTVIMALLITVVQLAVSSITAYALTGLDVPCKNLIFILILGGMMIPFESTMLANYLFVAQNGLRNQYLGLILPFLLSPAGIFLMRQQFKSIPKEIYDAAAIDGCGPVRLFLRLLLPMSGNALASLAILSMITAWNQYIWPLLVTNKKRNAHRAGGHLDAAGAGIFRLYAGDGGHCAGAFALRADFCGGVPLFYRRHHRGCCERLSGPVQGRKMQNSGAPFSAVRRCLFYPFSVCRGRLPPCGFFFFFFTEKPKLPILRPSAKYSPCA